MRSKHATSTSSSSLYLLFPHHSFHLHTYLFHMSFVLSEHGLVWLPKVQVVSGVQVILQVHRSSSGTHSNISSETTTSTDRHEAVHHPCYAEHPLYSKHWCIAKPVFARLFYICWRVWHARGSEWECWGGE